MCPFLTAVSQNNPPAGKINKHKLDGNACLRVQCSQFQFYFFTTTFYCTCLTSDRIVNSVHPISILSHSGRRLYFPITPITREQHVLLPQETVVLFTMPDSDKSVNISVELANLKVWTQACLLLLLNIFISIINRLWDTSNKYSSAFVYTVPATQKAFAVSE